MTRILITGGSGFIGTNMVPAMQQADTRILSLDINPPLNPLQLSSWEKVDILDQPALQKTFHEFQPAIVIHLAARTDCVETTSVEEGYKVNTLGTAHVLEATRNTPSVQHIIITSSQFVCRPGYNPQHDTDFSPHTVYGASKVQTEQITRSADLPTTWTIIRPTNIWGPWHLRYRREFWRVVEQGLYLHPSGNPVIRSYGYVENIIWQVKQILEAPRDLVHRKVFYVGDKADDIRKWTNEFSIQLTGHPVRTVPRWIIKALARTGDIFTSCRIPFPITSSRFRSMTQDYPVPLEKTLETFGTPPHSLKEGVARTVQWLHNYSTTNHAEKKISI